MRGFVVPEDVDVQRSVEQVEEILSPKKFNLAEAIQNRSYPEDSVVIFLDQEAAYDLAQVDAAMKTLSDHSERDKDLLAQYEVYEQEAEALRQRIIESSLKLTLRGLDQATIDATLNEAEKIEDGTPHDTNVLMLSKVLVSVQDHEGAVDDSPVTVELVEQLYAAMGAHEWDKVMTTMNGVLFAATYFDRAVDAGFLSRR